MPPTYEATWQPVWAAQVDRIEINHGKTPSVATIGFPALGWEQSAGLSFGDRVRIRTDHVSPDVPTTIFSGFVTKRLAGFDGSSQEGRAWERNAILCQDHRWLMHISSPVTGQWARGADDYSDGAAIEDRATWMTARRTIFNADGGYDKDLDPYVVRDAGGTWLCDAPIFCAPTSSYLRAWTARDMIAYLLAPMHNKAYGYVEIGDPMTVTGLDDEAFDRILQHVVVDGLSVMEAIDMICRQVGCSFREEYDADGNASLVFYHIGQASETISRSAAGQTIRHTLHAPARGEEIGQAVAEGKIMLHKMSLDYDIGPTINTVLGQGAPTRLEFTAELTPGWIDSEFTVPGSPSYDDVFKTEAELHAAEDPDSFGFFKYYHTRGSEFERDIGRKWVLNETGAYTGGSYDRGEAFDFDTIAEAGELVDTQGRPIYALRQVDGRRAYGLFARQLLPCLTRDPAGTNSLGILVEFSFDGGSTWQQIPCAINSLPDEAGLWIAEPNLAEMLPVVSATISGGDLDGKELNYWTSLCDDRLNSRSFKGGQWKTLVRVTASVQMDQRLRVQVDPSEASGSPFFHARLYDFSDQYAYQKRTSTSELTDSGLPAGDRDDAEYFREHLETVRRANEDRSISGQFTLERLWLGDGVGWPTFAVGDQIERISGREIGLAAASASGEVYPEIVQILMLPQRQHMRLLTRDLRFAEVVL